MHRRFVGIADRMLIGSIPPEPTCLLLWTQPPLGSVVSVGHASGKRYLSCPSCFTFTDHQMAMAVGWMPSHVSTMNQITNQKCFLGSQAWCLGGAKVEQEADTDVCVKALADLIQQQASDAREATYASVVRMHRDLAEMQQLMAGGPQGILQVPGRLELFDADLRGLGRGQQALYERMKEMYFSNAPFNPPPSVPQLDALLPPELKNTRHLDPLKERRRVLGRDCLAALQGLPCFNDGTTRDLFHHLSRVRDDAKEKVIVPLRRGRAANPSMPTVQDWELD